MIRLIVAGLLVAAAATQVAANPIGVTVASYGLIDAGDPFKASLESIGVGRQLEAALLNGSPISLVDIVNPTRLNFRLIESRPDNAGAPGVRSLTVGGTTVFLPVQGFDANGPILFSQVVSGSFDDLITFSLSSLPIDQQVPWPDGIQTYIRTADTALITGIDISIGNLDTLYFSVGDLGLVQVSAVPEPETWAMVIAGFGAIGGTMRRSRRRLALAGSRP